MGNLKIEDDDSDDENPYATKSSAKPETTTTYTGYDARGTPYRQSQTSSAIGSSSTIPPRSNFARVKSDNVKNAGGTIQVTGEAARTAIGRQRYRDDDSSDSEYGYM